MRPVAEAMFLFVMLVSTIPAVTGQTLDDMEYIVVTTEGDTAVLNCSRGTNDTKPLHNNYRWILPRKQDGSLKMLTPGEQDGEVYVSDNGWKITVEGVTAEHVGLFHCMIPNTDQQWEIITKAINPQGPFFQPGWDLYKKNLLIGSVSFLGSLVLMAAAAKLGRNTWSKKNPDKAATWKRQLEGHFDQGHVNTAFEKYSNDSDKLKTTFCEHASEGKPVNTTQL